MTRKEFILIIINKKIKPLLYILILFYSIYFLTQAIVDKKSDERNVLIFIVILTGILLLFGILHLIINYFKRNISEKTKSFFKIVSTITEVISGILLIGLAIHSWKENKIFEFIITLGIITFTIYTQKSKKIQ